MAASRKQSRRRTAALRRRARLATGRSLTSCPTKEASQRRRKRLRHIAAESSRAARILRVSSTGIVVGLLLASLASAAVVIDRIAVIVDKHAVKLSDVDRDVRVTEFLNREPLNLSGDAKRKAADRLIDQQIIRIELTTGSYGRAHDSDTHALLQKFRRDRFAGSDARLRQALTQYGLTEDQLRSQMLWQLTVLDFIDERFRPGVLVTDEQVKAYYDQHPALHKVAYDKASTQIRNTLEGEQVNQQFDAWLDSERKRTHIEFREEALK